MRFVDSTLADIRVETDGKYYSLYPTTTANQYRLYYTSWIEDTTKTRFDSILTSTNTEVSVPNYYTTDDTMYYFLENRRITENFVDENGTKITAPTGFTQESKQSLTATPTILNWRKNYLIVTTRMTKPIVLKAGIKGKRNLKIYKPHECRNMMPL